jgi:uncharacterized protein (TIGR03118 family)
MLQRPYTKLAAASLLCALAVGSRGALADTVYKQTNLVSDLPGVAAITDPNVPPKLQNPWGLDRGPTGPLWVSNNGTNSSTLYNGAGQPQSLVVSVPGSPTGIAFNGTTGFKLANGRPATFLFAGEGGTLSGWNGGTTAALAKDMSSSGAIYKGLTIATVGSAPRLFATNFHAGAVDTFDSSFNYTGSFTDTTVGDGFAPFNVQNIGDHLFVTFAKQDADREDDVAGAGNGFVDEFNPDGTLVRRFASNGTLNSPWGVALAPASFGQFGGDLLIGNFGDGRINAFDPTTGSFLGQLQGANGPLAIEGLWGLKFGNGAAAGPTDTLFFTAGIAGPGAIEDHGLFGSITAVPEPSSGLLIVAGLACVVLLRKRVIGSV